MYIPGPFYSANTQAYLTNALSAPINIGLCMSNVFKIEKSYTKRNDAQKTIIDEPIQWRVIRHVDPNQWIPIHSWQMAKCSKSLDLWFSTVGYAKPL